MTHGDAVTAARAEHICERADCTSARIAGHHSAPIRKCASIILSPLAFAVDLYSTPHNDVSTQTFVPVSLPWINANGEWLSLANPALGIPEVAWTVLCFSSFWRYPWSWLCDLPLLWTRGADGWRG